MSAPIKYYYDLMSQPSRALYILLKQTKIPFEAKKVALRNAEHLDDSFKAINRFQKVPCIVDQDFNLSESIAIVRYLSREKTFVDHWYPKETKKQALVDEYLEWQHNNTRITCAIYFQLMWLRPLLTGKPSNPQMVKEFKQRMIDCLDTIENVWLTNKFIVGDTISVADLWAACEIEQLKLTDYNAFENRPNLKAWMERVREITNPDYDDAHKIINKMAENKNVKNKL